MLALYLASAFKVDYFPVRKPGKLPGKVIKGSYTLEYGKDELEVQDGTIMKDCKVLIIDDLLATGGTLATTENLLSKLGANVIGHYVLFNITALGGEKKLKAKVAYSIPL